MTGMGPDSIRGRWRDHEDMASVSFFLGPVQSFIEAARTVRDLWTGSYLLSYLTFQAMGPILRGVPNPEDAFVFPSVRGLPLWQLEQSRGKAGINRPDERSLLIPSIPNKFIAVVPRVGAPELAAECERACRAAWNQITEKVWQLLQTRFPEGDKLRWDEQVSSFFEVRTAVLPWRDADRRTLKEWVDDVPAGAGDDDSLWTPRMNLLGGLMEASRSIRHVPSYFPEGVVPQKCTLLGTYEQMGPAELKESREFWKRFAAERGENDQGTRTGPRERLCAISLVKRFAWPASLAPRLDMEPTRRRFPDTATVAAARWLAHEPALDPDQVWNDESPWSGQWLHWKKHDEGVEEGEDAVPPSIWSRIEAKKDARSSPGHPRLPSYYAVLMLDGDHMGKWLRGQNKRIDERRVDGGILQSTISQALSRFALDLAPGIVEGPKPVFQGTLIYSGGDDVLAMLPTEIVLGCAEKLRTAYRENWPKAALGAAEDATVSGGIAVAHYKEDLRFVLDAARRAEKAAKNGGRDALALTICRRSGEHTTALVTWDLVRPLQELVGHFQNGASDRWAYTLRAELPALEAVPQKGFESEVLRLIGRVDEEKSRKSLQEWTERFLPGYLAAMLKRRRKEPEIRRDFVILCQSASFLARGRDNR